ncbi:hypothetical protein SAMD00019534_066810 [Acytostelium subglobosum LB1]|uniref:hypothetical protein n=1 Tax=Acytostelium subglobosum LB1 TaxID=1410327 RepID=UPI000644B50A|nr:hypothetical protein SAMD00019534_066810 [Acytostelium subglobosum LB1]GAM23506.1 hypothetical protein SAMD00019534_066810 [Acytostelium subglobosum LB1]|eukprot:XP_012753247.1 hypothetical protein SAMD00019534_066810 [Acytostelium subglobosum LB1]
MSEQIIQAIKFRLASKPEEIEPRVNALIKSHDEALKAIIDIPVDKKTFENTYVELDRIDNIFTLEEHSLTFPANVAVSKELRDASNDAQSTLSKYQINTFSRVDLYRAFADFVEANPNYKDALDAEQQRLVTKTLEAFEKNGLQLPAEKREKLKEIKSAISDLSIAFGKNVAEDKSRNEFTREQLKGIPDDIIDSLERTTDGKFIVTCKAPEYMPAMKYCEVTETRKKIEYTYGSRCLDTNVDILSKTLKLRREAAALQGKEEWSAVVTQYNMAKSPANVRAFQKRMIELLKPYAIIELEKLSQLKAQDYKERGLPLPEPEIKSYEYGYYNNMMLVKDYSVDNNLVKAYFPFELVCQGIFDVYQDLLGVKFQEVAAPFELWHPEVKLYSVTDSTANGELMGYFFLDLYPRDGKYTHFAVWPSQPGFNRPGARQLPVPIMVCNFTKSTETAPSLLTHDEVVTFFHEFGHVMHNINTTVKYSNFSGTSVERDFVECPSQLFENWCWDAAVLDRLSGHYKDHSKKLPADLIKKMLDSKNLNISLFYLRQLLFSSFDQRIHSNDVDSFEKTEAIWAEMARDIAMIQNQPGTNPSATFGHLFGYDAAYYSYMWSEVFSFDIFSKFEEQGVMNKELGKKLRDQVLAVGGSQDSNVTLKNFLGRTPDEKPFLKSIGLGSS